MSREVPELELQTDIRDLTALYYMIWSRKSSEWLQSRQSKALKTDLGV